MPRNDGLLILNVECLSVRDCFVPRNDGLLKLNVLCLSVDCFPDIKSGQAVPRNVDY